MHNSMFINKPKFEWQSDSTEVNAITGTANFIVNGNTINVHLNSFGEANRLYEFICKAYEFGLDIGLSSAEEHINNMFRKLKNG